MLLLKNSVQLELYNMIHQSVLLHETINALEIKKGDVVVDGTLGGGGHSEEILKTSEGDITLLAMDLDEDALERSKKRLENFKTDQTKIFYLHGSFREMDKLIKDAGFNSVDKIVLDLGLSSFQLEESGRGFTFKKDEPLAMTFGKNPGSEKFSAHYIVNSFEEENLADIIYVYGEEKFSRRIAKAIAAERVKSEIKTTFQLSEIIKDAVPMWYRRGKLHPATKTFQALRIAVNDELGALKEVLHKGFYLLNPNGRMAIISFHSLEDRLVKNFFREMADQKLATLLTKKPITPQKEEINLNPRSRSSKLRGIIKIS